MKKLLRFSLLALFAVLGMSNAMAGSIVFADLSLENGVQYTDPFDGGDFTVTFAGGGNDGKYYTTGSAIRLYGGGTMTIAAKSGTLKKIVITFDGTNKPEDANVVDGGTYDPTTGTWTGDAETVVFTRPNGSGHWRVKKIEVGDGASSDVPTEGQTAATAITVERALEIISALEDGKSTDYTYYVKGTVSEVQQVTSSGATFLMGDLKCYKLKGLENKDIVNTEFVKANDEVVVYGVLQKYKDNQDVITPEVSSGYVYSVNGKTQDDSENPEDAITKGKEADSPMTVDEALAYIENFSDNFITTNKYYISGTVSEVTEISTANGNATFNMGNLVVYRAKGLENKNITDENYLKANDEVIVYAKLQKYVKENTATPELSGGYIYSLNGRTTDEDPTVKGSKTNPYTVEEIQAFDPDETESFPSDKVWVKGYIAGCVNTSNGNEVSTEDPVASNLALSSTGTVTSVIPVQLPSGAVRNALNVADNAGNVGKEVLVFGNVQKYCQVAGVKNVTQYEFTGNETEIEIVTGIQKLTIDTDVNAPMYNLKGERVDANYRGVVIQNGAKRIQK